MSPEPPANFNIKWDIPQSNGGAGMSGVEVMLAEPFLCRTAASDTLISCRAIASAA